MSIHASDPFATPDEQRSPVRRLRGRLPAAVTLWTAHDRNGDPHGLTISSTVIVDGAPARLLGTVDPESTLWEAMEQTKRFTVAALATPHRQLADIFAGLMPAPGGPFRAHEWHSGEYGPVITALGAWAGCRLDTARPFGWGLLVEATIERVELADPEQAPAAAFNDPLVHFRGRYRTLAT